MISLSHLQKAKKKSTSKCAAKGKAVVAEVEEHLDTFQV